MEEEAELEERENDDDNLLSGGLGFQSVAIGTGGRRKWKILIYLQCCKFYSTRTAFRFEDTKLLSLNT